MTGSTGAANRAGAPPDADGSGRVLGAQSDLDDALLRLCRVMIAVTVKAGNKLDPTISAMQARTLTILSAAPEGLSLNAVAEALAATASATSRICARLVRDGLIDRRSGPGNEIRLSLSPYGISALSNLNRARLEQLEPLLDVLPAEHRATVMQGLHQFAAAAERVGGPW